MIRKFLLFFVVLMSAACSARSPSSSALVVPDSVAWNGDPELAPVLRRAVFGPDQLNGVERLQKELGPNTLIDRAAAIAEDTSAPNIVRANALKLLASRKATGELSVFANALENGDEFVRLAAITSMSQFLNDAPQTATAILARGLRDRSLRIQAHALEVLGDRDEIIEKGEKAINAAEGILEGVLGGGGILRPREKPEKPVEAIPGETED